MMHQSKTLINLKLLNVFCTHSYNNLEINQFSMCIWNRDEVYIYIAKSSK